MERSKKLYADIFNAIELVEQFVSAINNFSEYTLDLKTQSAVERQLSIIGEALTQLRNINENIFDITSSQQIISFRNRLVHAYDSIDNAVVWAIVKKHLPLLKLEVESKL